MRIRSWFDNPIFLQLPAKKSHGRKTKCTGCPFMKKKNLQRRFKEHAWESEVLDIEDLVQLGQGLGTCPYYGSRHMIHSADLVIMPYQSLLHHQTRESLGVKLDGCVVVIDEAHNLVDSISDMHSCQISFSQVSFYFKPDIFHILHPMFQFISHTACSYHLCI